jgi:hypothetical protein
MISIISFDYVRHVTIFIEGKLGLYYGKIDGCRSPLSKNILKRGEQLIIQVGIVICQRNF